MNREKIIRQIKRLIYASDSFQKIEAVIQHIEAPDTKIDGTLYSAMIGSVVTTYALNFNQSNGIGPLPKVYERFDDSKHQEAHGKLIAARNQLYAHRDVHSARGSNEQAYKIEVWLQNGMLLQRPYLIDVSHQRLPEIKSLIAFQRIRLQQDLDGKLALVIDPEKEYKEGEVWELGVDFP